MHYPRWLFTPCVFKALLYLASVEDHRVVESFSRFVANGEILLLTDYRQMARWKIESESHPPLIVGTKVYISNDSKVEKWSLEANRFV